MHGDDGNDLLAGHEAADNLFGDYGNDLEYGYRIGQVSALDEDRLEGGPDDDMLCGTHGANFMIGGTSIQNLSLHLGRPGSTSGRTVFRWLYRRILYW